MFHRLRRQVRQLKAEVALKHDPGYAAILPTQQRRIWEEAGRFVLEGSKRASMRAGTGYINARERNAGEGGEQGKTDSEDGGGSDNSEVLHQGCTMPSETITTGRPHGNTGAVENSTSYEGSCPERTDKIDEPGVIVERRRLVHRRSLSATSSASVSVSSPPERHERFPSLGTTRHAHELCLALREFVWETAVATTTEPLRESSGSGTNNNDNVRNKGEHENKSRVVQSGNAEDKKSVYSAAATVRSAVRAAVEGRNSWIVQQDNRQGGEHRRLKKRGRRRRPLAAHNAEETEGWVPRAQRLRRGESETDDVRPGAIESSHLPQSGEQLVCSTPEVAEQSVATASSRERHAVRSARVRKVEEFGMSHGSPDNSDATRFPIPTIGDGRVGGGDAGDLGGAFERFKQGPGRDIDDRLQVKNPCFCLVGRLALGSVILVVQCAIIYIREGFRFMPDATLTLPARCRSLQN